MMNDRSEASMSPAISAWLERRGLRVYTEVSVTGRSVDFIGSGDGILVAVEAKIRFDRTVVRQAMVNQVFAHESWIATFKAPRRSRYLAACQQHGLGLYAVGADKVVLPAVAEKFTPIPRSVEQCRHVLARHEPGGTGGIQHAIGIGPAQDVARMVAPHRAAGKSWRWIFENVPNHYANHRSLAGVMMNYAPARVIMTKKGINNGASEARGTD